MTAEEKLGESTEQITFLRFVHESRLALIADGVAEDELGDTRKIFHEHLHDAYCAGVNPYFDVAVTADGEPFVDWLMHTPTEWAVLIGNVDTLNTITALKAAFDQVFGGDNSEN